jgi:hypothetical protein
MRRLLRQLTLHKGRETARRRQYLSGLMGSKSSRASIHTFGNCLVFIRQHPTEQTSGARTDVSARPWNTRIECWDIPAHAACAPPAILVSSMLHREQCCYGGRSRLVASSHHTIARYRNRTTMNAAAFPGVGVPALCGVVRCAQSWRLARTSLTDPRLQYGRALLHNKQRQHYVARRDTISIRTARWRGGIHSGICPALRYITLPTRQPPHCHRCRRGSAPDYIGTLRL